MPPLRVWPGQPWPLGATFDGAGTNFAVFSDVAEKVDLCLLSTDGGEIRVELAEASGPIRHAYLPDVRPGQRYGFRVHGPWEPSRGLRCNPAKLLIDPYAKAVEGEVRWDPAVFGHNPGDPFGAPNPADSAPFVPKGIVTLPYFDWGNDRRPHRPRHETILYELHVKGFTQRHPAVPEHLRGTYAGLAHPDVIDHLVDLGVTAVELMPVHQFVHPGFLRQKGLRNYWGYDSLGFFAPHDAYAGPHAPGEQVQQFKQMVKALHEAGLEVILDVVYNHTAEGNHEGPTLSLRGLDNAAYYHLSPDDPRYCMDWTGCGNSLNMGHPRTVQLVLDSLRYWVVDMHVDGFRFDLASALARELYEVDQLATFFQIIQQDPIVGRVKLIAEPWDLGAGGYQVGNFPTEWSEWNGRYRDAIRDFWRGEPGRLGELAARITGSSDLYESSSRRPSASVNFVTAHDGFTLRDLVSYDRKHNEANGEGNRDGSDDNRSWNCGVEGDTDDPAILALRARQQRNLLFTLLLSQGIPMLSHGDELGRTQRGNNNAWCQDDELAWVDWDAADADLLAFTRRLVNLRRDHPAFRRKKWFEGRNIRGTNLTDIGWFRPDGDEMSDEDWQTGFARSLGVFLHGDGLHAVDKRGREVRDDSFYLIFHGGHEPLDLRIPSALGAAPFVLEVDTSVRVAPEPKVIAPGSTIEVPGRCCLLLRRPR
jgi:glycogen operon protein